MDIILEFLENIFAHFDHEYAADVVTLLRCIFKLFTPGEAE